MRNMTLKTVRNRMLKVGLLGLCMISTLALAQDGRLAKKVDLFLKEADLLAATQMLTKQTGIQFVIVPSKDPFDRINLSLANVTADQAIKYLCEAAGAYAEQDESGVYVIRRGGAPANLKSNNNPGDTVNPKLRKPLRVERIKILKANPEHVYQMLLFGDIDLERDMRELRKFEVEQAFYQMKRQTSRPLVPDVTDGGAFPVTTGRNLPQDSSSNPLEGGMDIPLPGETANQRQPGGGNQPGGGQNNQGGGTAPVGGTGYVPEGIRKVSFDPTTNSLIVEGDDEAIRQLRNLVNLFDQVPKQVIIKIEFITTSQSVSRSLGMDWLYQRGAISAGNRPGTFAEVGNPIFINYATGNITTRLRTLLTEGGGKTVNAPLIRTLNNQQAIINQQLQTYILTTQTTTTNTGNIQNTIAQPLTITTGLSVKPRINEDGYVTMYLTPQIQDLGQVRRDANGNSYPDFSSQSLQVVARVKSGSTIALGGLTRKQTRSTQNKFPILADLPIIGGLFRSQSTERNDSELLIFVTPIIIEDDDLGGLGP